MILQDSWKEWPGHSYMEKCMGGEGMCGKAIWEAVSSAGAGVAGQLPRESRGADFFPTVNRPQTKGTSKC